MQTIEQNHPSAPVNLARSTSIKVVVGWLIFFFALSTAGWVGMFSEEHWGFTGKDRYGLQAVIMSGIVLPAIWALRKMLDRGTPKSIGAEGSFLALAKFGLGLGLFLVPAILTLFLSSLFGWGNFTIHANGAMLTKLFAGIGTVLLFEALPEEMAFRGYVYSNLNTWLKRWQAGLLTTGLFVLLPVLLTFFQQYVLGMEIRVGGSDTITASYVLMMFFFGAFTMYLRILTKSVWTGVGFHLIFVYINRLIGPKPTNFIQFTDMPSETPVQIVLISSLTILFIGLLVYPRLAKFRIGWKDVDQA